MNDVFISYSNRDRAFVERLVRDLDSQGLSVFYDQRIPPGESWADSLTRAIESARHVLVVLSPQSVASPWVLQEVSLGLAREAEGQTLVVPLLIEPCEIPPQLQNKTYASFDTDYGAGLSRIVAVLKGASREAFAAGTTSAVQAEQIRADVAQFKKAPAAAVAALVTPPAPPAGAPRADKRQCFIVMPFGNEDLQVVYEDFVKPVLEDDCGLMVERGDDVFGSNVIMDDIRSSIQAADLIVADLTGKNPNVFYEVGICHTLDKPVLLMAQSMEEVPFDLRHRRVLLYTYTPRGCKKLEGELRAHIQSMLAKLEADGP